MNVCNYVCMYVCMYVCAYIHPHTRLYLPVLAQMRPISFVETLLLSMEFELHNLLLGVGQIGLYVGERSSFEVGGVGAPLQ